MTRVRKSTARLRGRPQYFRVDTGHPLAKGLRFLFAGDGVGNDTVWDSSPARNHGTASSAAASWWTWDAYLRRWTLLFPFSKKVYLPVDMVNGLSQLSMAAWINLDQFNVDYGVVLGWSKTSANDAFRAALCTRSTGALEFGGRAPDTQAYGAWTTTATMSARQWHHVAMTADLPSKVVNLYIDGKLQSLAATGTFTNAAFDNTNSAVLGGGIGTLGLYLNGSTIDSGVWSRVLSPGEISSLADPSNLLLDGLLVPPLSRRQMEMPGEPPITVSSVLCDLAQAGASGLQVCLFSDNTIGFAGSGGPAAAVRTGTTYNDGSPHQILVTRSGTTYTLYVDGVAIGSDATGTAPTLTRLALGNNIGETKPAGVQVFEGFLVNRVLT